MSFVVVLVYLVSPIHTCAGYPICVCCQCRSCLRWGHVFVSQQDPSAQSEEAIEQEGRLIRRPGSTAFDPMNDSIPCREVVRWTGADDVIATVGHVCSDTVSTELQ